MVATTDIDFKLMKWEKREFHHALMDRIDTYEAALLGLTEAVTANRELIMANHELTQRQFAALHEKVDALMVHFDVPYKPPAGFVKE